jgi:ribosomal protein L3 glutamine methyltransferase
MTSSRLDDAALAAGVAELCSATDMVRWGASRLTATGTYAGHGHGEAVDEALALTLHALHLPFGTPDVLLGARLTRDERIDVVRLVARRINERVPTAYLTGEAWFAGLRFICDKRALVPRSPFAELIQQRFVPWVEPDSVLRIADIGTGGGSIAIAAAQFFPEALIDAVDISADALELAAENIALHGLEDRVRLHHGDLFEPLQDERYDLILSNPPYVPEVDVDGAPDEFRHEPRAALAAGEDGMDVVARLVEGAYPHLTDNGVLMVETGASWVGVEERYQEIGLAWVDLERGGDGIFVVERDALEIYAAR